MHLSLLEAFFFSSRVAVAADRQINQISAEQTDSDTINRLLGSDLIPRPKDRVFCAAEASNYPEICIQTTQVVHASPLVEVTFEGLEETTLPVRIERLAL